GATGRRAPHTRHCAMERLMQRNALPVVTGPQWPGVRYFCTTRAGGVGVAPYDTLNLGARAGDDTAAVRENRARIRAAVPGDPLWLRQVHGADVIDADAGSADEPAGDAGVRAAPGRVLAILVADCLPVGIADLDGQAVGVAHAGWGGLAGGVLENALARLRAKAPGARGWRAWIGPGIGPAAFEVGDDVRAAFAADGPEAQALFAPRPGLPGKWLADLPALALLRLRRAGVEDAHASGLCTVSDPARFFSYRRDGTTGRMALLAWRE